MSILYAKYFSFSFSIHEKENGIKHVVSCGGFVVPNSLMWELRNGDWKDGIGTDLSILFFSSAQKHIHWKQSNYKWYLLHREVILDTSIDNLIGCVFRKSTSAYPIDWYYWFLFNVNHILRDPQIITFAFQINVWYSCTHVGGELWNIFIWMICCALPVTLIMTWSN